VKVIAGLGNPGLEYAQTPHNVGFDVVAELAVRCGAGWRASRRFQARLARAKIAGEECLLVQPQTFMNRSGASVAAVLRYHGGAPEDLLVVLDDADLPLGRLRVRKTGGSGGHRGLASVIEALGSEAFARVRLGVGRDGPGGLVDYVLGRFDGPRLAQARQSVTAAADAALDCMVEGVDKAMNRWNGWRGDGLPAAGNGTEAEMGNP
jgi:PTH1 family peptidyl-tRNA hydrolase